MIKEAIEKILTLALPNYYTDGNLKYVDKKMELIRPPTFDCITCSTLESLADLVDSKFEGLKADEVLIHVCSTVEVDLISKTSDEYGRRKRFATCTYPEVKSFPFGQWMDPETFIIQTQSHFQRVKIENDDGSFAKDLDYVLGIASRITAENAVENVDDGLAQRVAVRQGIAMKAEAILRPRVNLAPYRTFAEVDQVVTEFVFRARVQNQSAHLAIFEADGGRWKIEAVENIAKWFAENLETVQVIS